MGIHLLMAAQSPTWATLSDRAFRVLTYMCACALDTPSRTGQAAAEYTGGHDQLARRLYGQEDVTNSQREMIRRAMKELRTSGAITILRPPSAHKYPIYRIDVEQVPNQDQLV